jgi:methenyltetrahydrofolate cyclohydrolase
VRTSSCGHTSPSARRRSATTDGGAARLNRLLPALASDQPAPAGGSAAAVTVAIAAALLEKVARLSTKHWPEAPPALERAARLRLDAEELVEADVHAYVGFVEARRQARQLPETARAAAIAPAFELAVTVPLAIVRVAVKAVELAAELAEHGNPNLHADAVTAALLASAAGAAAARLVAVNLAGAAGDPRVAEAQRRARSASSLADRLAGS